MLSNIGYIKGLFYFNNKHTKHLQTMTSEKFSNNYEFNKNAY